MAFSNAAAAVPAARPRCVRARADSWDETDPVATATAWDAFSIAKWRIGVDERDARSSPTSDQGVGGSMPVVSRANCARASSAAQMDVASSRKDNRIRGRGSRLRGDGIGRVFEAARVEMDLRADRILRTHENPGAENGCECQDDVGFHDWPLVPVPDYVTGHADEQRDQKAKD